MHTEINANWRPQNFTGGSKSGRKYGSRAPDHQPEPEPPRPQPWEMRRFDIRTGMWLRVETQAPARAQAPERRAAIPVGDGSGVFWDAVDTTTNHRLWTIEGQDFAVALDEKRRLCAVSGFKGKFVRLILVRG